ncbi:MAG: META domain-containing protein [Melioribacteraceae bacterium]|nr:META domain-containing protein [Melioribacteraceae bacterium]
MEENIKGKRVIIYLIFSLLFITCKDTITETDSKELLEKLWILESFEENGTTIIPLSNQTYNIQFFTDSTMKGRSDCNQIGGKYRLGSNNSIKVIEFGTTKVHCGEKSKYDEYSTAISEIYSYRINYDKLYLYYKEKSKMIFIKE